MVLMALVISTTFGLSGCEEEVGCTNRRADNYNPDAVTDDGTCINARDKFLGIYSVLQICWPDTLLPQPRYITVAEDDLRVEEKDDVKLLNFAFDSLTSVTIRALIDKNTLTIPRQDLGVGENNIPMVFTGEGHIDDDRYLTILYSIHLPNGDPVRENCVIFCTPVE